jgi:hypothetical protein
MHVLPKMDTSFDPDDDLSTAFGPETLAERDMVSAAYQNAFEFEHGFAYPGA